MLTGFTSFIDSAHILFCVLRFACGHQRNTMAKKTNTMTYYLDTWSGAVVGWITDVFITRFPRWWDLYVAVDFVTLSVFT